MHALVTQIINYLFILLDGAGKQVLFCNLAADPAIFEGPAGDVQVLSTSTVRDIVGY